MERHSFLHNGLILSYLDAGSDGKPLIALHAHWMEGQTYSSLGTSLAPEWRVIAPDQRGHGYSDHAPTYTRADYLDDLSALYAHLGIESAVLLGNSLGGVNAYQFAARYPKRATALIIEDIDAEIDDDTSFALAWEGMFPTREALAERVGARFLPYLSDSIRQTASGWRLTFEPREMVISQGQLNGDHWADWLASTCPALLIRGAESRVTTTEQCEQMASRRTNTRLVTLPGSHVVHVDDPTAFADTVKSFLGTL